MRVVIAGAGPSGFACAKWLSDRGHAVTLLEKRAIPGGKVSAWRDTDGDWIESGLHVFFGAYHNLLGFLAECGLEDSFDWKPAEMVFASPEHGLAAISFVKGLPAPLNGLAGVARSPLLPTRDKLRMALGLIWPIFGSQAYVDSQDDQSYAAWHLRHGMGQRSLEDVMHTMALALNFQRADQVSAKLVLTALLHFAKETEAPKMGLVKGSPHERLWVPLIRRLEQRGVQIRFNQRVQQVLYDAPNNRVTGFAMQDGSVVDGDIFISAMPVHSVRKVLPESMRVLPGLAGISHLKGQPVITVQLYFDRFVTTVNNLLFSAGTRMSVYADLALVSPDYHTGRGSIVELVIAPAADLIVKDDTAVIDAVLCDFYRMHPEARNARLLKSVIVRIPNSVYQARPGVDKCRPDQAPGVSNFFLTGDYTQQEFMASIEGSIRSARRTVTRVNETLDTRH